MGRAIFRYWPVGTVAAVIGGVLALTLAPYGGNSTALFHMDAFRAARFRPPPGFVVLQIPGYDGMEYYGLARDLPAFFSAEGRARLGVTPTRAYAAQRILLPALSALLAFGRTRALPIVFLAINVAALLATCAVVLRWKRHAALYAIALALSPAALIGLHFSLAEPLTLLLVTTFLVRFCRSGDARITASSALLLSAATLSREVNILLVAFFVAWCGMRRQWRSLLWLALPIAVFLAWHGTLRAIFDTVPFLWSAGKRAFPGSAATAVLFGLRGYDALRLSSIALILGFVLPATVLSVAHVRRTGLRDPLPLLVGAFLAVMWTMPDHIWGSITSIGRVITPVYPATLLLCAQRDAWVDRLLAAAILAIGIAASVALALIPHAFQLA